MTKNFLIRLAAVILLVWSVGAITSWMLFDPSDSLVGAKPGRGGATTVYNLAARDLREAADLLSKNAIWGIQRDGSVRVPDASKENAEEKMPEWRMLAAVVKGKDRYLLIQVDKQRLESVKEGERLPDGSLVKIVSRKMYTILTTDDEEKTTYLNFDEPSYEQHIPASHPTRKRK